MIPSFQRSHFFPTANFFPGLSKFQQPIFFNSIILRFPVVTFLSWPLYNFFPANHFFFGGQIQRLFQTTYQIFFFFKKNLSNIFPWPLSFLSSKLFFFFCQIQQPFQRSCQIHTHIEPANFSDPHTHIEPVKYIHTHIELANFSDLHTHIEPVKFNLPNTYTHI